MQTPTRFPASSSYVNPASPQRLVEREPQQLHRETARDAGRAGQRGDFKDRQFQLGPEPARQGGTRRRRKQPRPRRFHSDSDGGNRAETGNPDRNHSHYCMLLACTKSLNVAKVAKISRF